MEGRNVEKRRVRERERDWEKQGERKRGKIRCRN